MAIPLGRLNRASLFVPSSEPGTPVAPAMVVTTQLVPERAIFRIVWFRMSETNKSPRASIATPPGKLKLAAPLVASLEPLTPGVPAIVENKYAPDCARIGVARPSPHTTRIRHAIVFMRAENIPGATLQLHHRFRQSSSPIAEQDASPGTLKTSLARLP